jgi:hypothetical protein
LSLSVPGAKLELFEQTFEHGSVVGRGKRLTTEPRRLPLGTSSQPVTTFDREEALR